MEPPPMITKAPAPGLAYGSLMEADLLSEWKRPSISTGRRSIDLFSLLQALLIPWGVFAGVAAVLTFRVRLAGLWIALLVLLVVRMAYMAREAWRRRFQPQGYAVLLIALFWLTTAVVGFIAGLVIGKGGSAMMKPYDVFTSMSIYFDVNPDVPGAQMVDAGRVLFLPGSRVAGGMAAGFKSGSVYCVAPVTLGKPLPGASYDFWAVGVDCCPGDGNKVDFRCGDVGDPAAYAGVRLLDDGQRPYYRLAVQQAEAAYRIRAPRPIFFHWSRDPIAEVHDSFYKARRRFSAAAATAFTVQFFLMCILATILARYHVFG